MERDMDQNSDSIAFAIRKAVAYVRQTSHLMVSDTSRLPTQQEHDHHTQMVEAICDGMDALATRSETEDVWFPEFEALRAKLSAFSSYPLNEDVSAVARAFMMAGRLDAKQTPSTHR